VNGADAAGGIVYVARRDGRPTLHRAEVDGVVVGGVVELADRSCEWYCRLRGRDGAGRAPALAEAQAALDAHLRGRDAYARLRPFGRGERRDEASDVLTRDGHVDTAPPSRPTTQRGSLLRRVKRSTSSLPIARPEAGERRFPPVTRRVARKQPRHAPVREILKYGAAPGPGSTGMGYIPSWSRRCANRFVVCPGGGGAGELDLGTPRSRSAGGRRGATNAWGSGRGGGRDWRATASSPGTGAAGGYRSTRHHREQTE
jgi:hypothetical protein